MSVAELFCHPRGGVRGAKTAIRAKVSHNSTIVWFHDVICAFALQLSEYRLLNLNGLVGEEMDDGRWMLDADFAKAGSMGPQQTRDTAPGKPARAYRLISSVESVRSKA